MPKRTQASVELNNVNMELRDKRYNDIRLIFHEEEHSYADTLNNSYISTTQILHQYQPKFDKNYWLRKKSKEDVEMKVDIVEFVENEMVELDVVQIGLN